MYLLKIIFFFFLLNLVFFHELVSGKYWNNLRGGTPFFHLFVPVGSVFLGVVFSGTIDLGWESF